MAGCSTLEANSPGTSTTPTPTPTDESESTSTPTESLTRAWESEFDQVVDAVADLGCDPTGDQPSDTAIETGVGDGVLIQFPSGTYQFQNGHVFDEVNRLGFLGTGDVSFIPPVEYNDKLVSFLGGWVLFAGIDVDVSAAQTTAGLRFITDNGFHVENVEFRGRGLHPNRNSVANALALAVRNSSEQGLVKNVVARRGSAIGHYKGGNGRVGMWIGGRHHGNIEVRDCHLEEFGNNGIYGSRCEGTVTVIGGLYRNNNVSGVRLGGGGNSIRGTTFEIDLTKYTGPYTRTSTQYDTRAIVVEQGPHDFSGRVQIEECDVRMVNADRSQGTIVVWPDGNGPRIERCRITTDVDWVSGIQASRPVSKVAAAERGTEIVDTRISGTGSSGSAIELVDRPASTIAGSTIDQRGDHRNGVRLVESNPCRIDSTTIATTQYPIFAINPVEGECLVSLTGDTQIEHTGPELDGIRSTRVADETGADTPRRCIGGELIADTAPFEGVGITNVDGNTVHWRHHFAV